MKFLKRFPHFKQNNSCDCGPTSMRMIARHYGVDYSTEMLRKHWHITRYERILKQNFASIHTREIEEEMKKHVAWRRKTSLVATPTVLVNGHILPDEYGMED